MTRTLLSTAAAGSALLSVAAAPAPEAWDLDPAHSAVSFSVKHFFTPVPGSFGQYEAQLVYDPAAPENSSVRVSIPVASIDTGNDRRDAHLLSEDFFDAETYPYITFVSTSVKQVGPDRLVVRGPLKIRGVTRDVELPVKVLGVMELAEEMQAAMGIKKVASFETELTISRNDFGVGVGSWAATAVVGRDVTIRIAIEANQK